MLSCDGDDYLVPIELVDKFNELEAIICEGETDDEDFYAICSEFDDKFTQYNLEGKLYGDTPLFVAKEIFE